MLTSHESTASFDSTWGPAIVVFNVCITDRIIPKMKRHFNTDVKFHEKTKQNLLDWKQQHDYTHKYTTASLASFYYILVLSFLAYTLYYKELYPIKICLNWLSSSEVEPKLFHGFISFQALGPTEVLTLDITNIYKQKTANDKCLEVPFLWMRSADDSFIT